MCRSHFFSRQTILTVTSLALVAFFGAVRAEAVSLNVTWQDNSDNEDGFKIERSTGGSYVEIASVGANTVTYVDSGPLDGMTYCYRARAFNSAGVSDPSNESCATTPVASFGLTLAKTGTGTGSVTSSPAGITCGSDCSENYSSGTVVSLTATPASGSTFAGWSGAADCSDGIVTMDANKSCTAAFNILTSPAYTLTVSVVSDLSSVGTGSGKVTSNPAGIACGNDCSETYSAGTVVSLSATPDPGSKFAGWSGAADCSDGMVTMDANKSCTAMFSQSAVNLNVLRNGAGLVSSNPAGIDCGDACSKDFPQGANVTLSAKPGAGSKFAGWSGGGCQGTGNCTVTLESSTSLVATFIGPSPASIGLFRPATGEWFLDKNRNGVWDGCNIDLCLGPFGLAGDVPVTGDWTGTGSTSIGTYRPATGEWFLDLNGNGKWDGCKVDGCLNPLRPQATLPLVGDWTGTGFNKIGEMVDGKSPKLYLDMNGDGVFQNCKVDACIKFSSVAGDLPVAGDWNSTGKTHLGIFRSSTGEWFLDLDGDGQFDNCQVDKCIKSFGEAEDLPVTGDWNGDGKAKIGVFRPSTGQWLLDLNGNWQWDGCGVDGCIQLPNTQEEDWPVAGAW